MFWLTIGRILLARWLIIATVMLSALAGGAIVLIGADKQYDATARVMLNISRPDPITGMRLDRKTVDPYVESQLTFIRDLQVVLPAVEAIGWLEDPELQATYNARPAGDLREFPVWLGQAVSQALHTSLVEDSNIIEIKYRGASPEVAALVVGAVRDAYIAGSVNERRRAAEGDAESSAERVNQLRADLEALNARKRALELETGIILTGPATDLDSDRLQALAAPLKMGARPILMAPAASQDRLAQIDLEIAQASQTLGPNHPALVQARQMRAALAAQADSEDRRASGVSAAVVADEQAKSAAYESQRERVLSRRQDALRLRLVQDQIGLKTRALKTGLDRVAYLRQLTTTTESGLTSIGDVKNLPGVAFPSIPLIMGGTGGLGLIAGILVALLVEMLNLRVRTLAGLRIAAPVPILGVMPPIRDEPAKTAKRLKRRAQAASVA